MGLDLYHRRTIRQELRKGADNKVFREKLSLNWTGPFKIIAVGPAPAADTPDGRPLGDKLLYLDLLSNLSGPAAEPRATNHSDLCRTPYTAAAHRCRGYLRCRPSGRFHCRPCGRLRRRRVPCTAPAAKPGPRAMYLGGFHRPHCAATAAELGPRAMYLRGFHRPHCAAAATELGPCAMYLLRQQNSALAPCTSAAFIAPTVPLRQQNSALAPCTCYGSNTRPSRHSSPGPRPATILGARIVIDGITGKYTRAPTLYRIALMARPLIFSKWLTRSLPQAAVDRHLAHLGLYPRSDSAGLAPVAPPPPPTDGCCGPHHTLLRPRTVLCCGPCSLTVVHFRGPRPCSSAPPPDGRVLWTPPHTPPLPYSTLLRPRSLTVHFRGPRLCSSAPSDGWVLWTPPHTPPLPYSTLLHCSPWLRPLRRFSPPPLRRSGGKRQPLPRPISRFLSPMLHCSPWLQPPRRFSPPPLRRSGGKRQPLPRPISRLVSPMLHCSPRLRPPRVFTPPPFAPVAPSARNGHTTPRSYAELTQMRISTFKTGAFETKTLISTLKPSPFTTKTLISTPKTTISTPEPIMPTSLELYPQPRGFRKIRLPCFIV